MEEYMVTINGRIIVDLDIGGNCCKIFERDEAIKNANLAYTMISKDVVLYRKDLELQKIHGAGHWFKEEFND